MTENISILGSTGSIGTQTLDVVREIGGIKVWAMSTNTRIELFEKQVREFKPEVVCVMDKNKALEFKKNISDLRVEVLSGMEGLIAVATYDKADTVVNSVVGNIGLVPTVKAICSGKNIALANKETLVTSGKLVMNLLKENYVSMYPVDSEHSAIFQCLQGNKDNKIKKTLEDILKEYESWKKKSMKYLKKGKAEITDSGVMAKMMAKMGIKKEVINDNSDSSIAKMIIKGVSTGSVDMEKKIKAYDKDVDKSDLKIAKEFLKFQEKTIDELKEYL